MQKYGMTFFIYFGDSNGAAETEIPLKNIGDSNARWEKPNTFEKYWGLERP